MRVVTTYPYPDLDGTSCALAYADLLARTGQSAVAVLHGKPDKEAHAALAYWRLPPRVDAGDIAAASEVILVDTSNLSDFPVGFDPQKVTEIIDHRELHEAESFPRARVQIELVGAAATLIAEKFQAASLEPTPAHAGLLAGAIASNTLLLRTSNTTDRDREMLMWTTDVARVDKAYFQRLRRARSVYAPGELYDYLVRDAAIRRSPSGTTSILQIEAEGAEQLLRTRKDEILRALADVRAEQQPEYAFVNTVDIGTGHCGVFADTSKERDLLTRRLHLQFDADGFARFPKLLLRKQLGPLL